MIVAGTCFAAGGATAFAQEILQELTSGRTYPYAQGDQFGFTVARLGDVDGDGVPDVVVGAPFEDDTSFIQYGAVYAFSGATGAELHKNVGPNEFTAYGATLVGGLDLDGDGLGDYVVGAYVYSSADHGAVFVYSGASGALLYSLTGENPGDQFGWSVAMFPDLDGDGLAEIGVGAPTYDVGKFKVQVGRVYIRSGKDGAPLFEITGTKRDEWLGQVFALGDLDLDGWCDIGVGATGITSGPNGEGRLDVYSGKQRSLLHSLLGEAQWDLFGWSGSDLGDIDSDGVSEFLVTAPGHQGSAGNVGRVYVFSGATAAILFQYDGAAGERIGTLAAQRIGDINGDGTPDTVIGGAGTGPSGLWGGTVHCFSGRYGSLLYTFRGLLDNASGYAEGLGSSLSGIGDFDGDGFADVLAGAPNYPIPIDGAGRAYVFGGNDLFLQASDEQFWPNDSITIGNRGGTPGALSIIALVDVNGAPTFVTVAAGALDSNGNLIVSDTVPPGLSGLTLTFMGWATKPGGKGLADSIPETIVFN